MQWTTEEAAHWRRRLRDEEGRLGRRIGDELSRIESETEDAANADDAVAGAVHEGTYDFLETQAEHQTRVLREIGDAWLRLDAGRFGVCEVCGEPIDRARLELVPYTRFCARHAA